MSKGLSKRRAEVLALARSADEARRDGRHADAISLVASIYRLIDLSQQSMQSSPSGHREQVLHVQAYLRRFFGVRVAGSNSDPAKCELRLG